MTAVTADPAEPAASPAPTRGPRTFGGYIGAFDGMRGIGLVAVLLYHGGYTILPGAYFSISMFFTLSGFLITMLMIREQAKTHTVALGAFWLRRARRLLPAALFTLLGVLLLRNYFTTIQPARLRGDVLAGLFYVENWWLIHTGQAYGAIFAEGSPVQHFWSLAIEEQYYLVFPLLMLGLFRFVRHRMRIAAILTGLMFASFAYAAHLSPNLDRAYYSTFSRASEILAGIVGAFLVSHFDRERTPRAQRAIDGLGIAAMLGMAWLWATIDLHDPFVFRGATFLNSLFTVIVIVACLQPGLVTRFLTVTPWRKFGGISYGVYLVHWPIFLILTEQRLGLGHNATFAVRVAVTLAVALAVYFGFENPIRQKKMLKRNPIFFAVIGVATALVIGIAVAMPDTDSQVVDLSSASPVTAQLHDLAATPKQAGAERVLVVGDSMSWSVWTGLDEWGRSHNVQFGRYSALGCGIGGPGTLKYLGLTRATFPDCALWHRDLSSAVRSFRPDKVLVVIGLADISPREFPGGTFRSIGDPVYDARLTARIRRVARTLTSTGAELRWVTFPHVDVPFSSGGTGTPPFVENDPKRMDELNALVADALAPIPGAEMVDLAAYMRARPGGELDPAFRPDGAHLSADGTREVARWLGPRLAQK
jgi:peptidoglycan/LPS O-acetylase OafA/YrhL/lysophospholipase L1-like esterase